MFRLNPNASKGFPLLTPQKRKVLLICEHEAGLQAGLESGGYQVLWVPDAFAGLHIAIATSVDVVIFEYGMPELNVDGFTKHLKQEKPGLPLVMLAENLFPSRELGVEAVLSRRITPRALAQALRGLLNRSSA